MPKCEARLVDWQGNEFTVEVLDEDSNTFTGKGTLDTPADILESSTICILVEGPMKVHGEYVPELEVCFEISDGITVELSEIPKFLRSGRGTSPPGRAFF